ncbi:MAG TPA: hypothetical protein VHP32_01725 [Ignavibacteria bacterium]|nr:hypothetical protein [Ignavibacteria bacterium]
MKTKKNMYMQKINTIRIIQILVLLSLKIMVCNDLFGQDNLLKSAGVISEKLSEMKTGFNPPPAFTVNSTQIVCIANNGAQGKTYSVTLSITPNFSGTISALSTGNSSDLISNNVIPFILTGNLQTQYTLNIRTTTTVGNNITLKFVVKKNLFSYYYQDVVIRIPECSICDCAPTPLSNIQLSYVHGTVQTISLACTNPSSVSLPAGVPFSVRANILCSPSDCSKEMRITLSRRVGSFWLFVTESVIVGNSNPLSCNFSGLSAGQYRVVINSKCGNNVCNTSCSFQINSSAMCNNCSGWDLAQLFDEQDNFIANLSNGVTLPLLEGGRIYRLKLKYKCGNLIPNNCPITYLYSINPVLIPTGCLITPITGSTVVSYPNTAVITFNLINCPSFASYNITITPKCDNLICTNDIIRTGFRALPKCTCEGRIEPRNVARFQDAFGNVIEKNIRCNPLTVNTIGPFPRNGLITILYDIPCTPGCAKSFSWVVKNPAGNIITTTPANYLGTGQANFTFAAPDIGHYLVEVTSSCGIQECRICAFRVKVEDMPCEFIDLGPNEETEICNPEGTVLTLTGFTGNASDVKWYRTTNPSEVPASNPSNLITVSGTPVSGTTYNTGNLYSNGCTNTVYRYQCVTTNPACTSDVKTVTVRPRISEIFVDASRIEICSRQEDITLTASTSRLPAQTECGCDIKWYRIDGNIRTYIGASSTRTISRTSLISECPGTKKIYTYEAVFCEGKCNQVSKRIDITVYSNPIAGNITADRDTLCFLDATTLHLNNHCGAEIQWQMSENAAGPFINMSGATYVNQNTNRLHVTTYYRALIRNGACAEVFSAVKEVVVQQPFNLSVSYAPNNCGNFLCPDVQLQAHVSGPMLDDNTYFEWYHNGNVISGSRNQQFLTATQSGGYNIIIFNNVRDDFDASCDTIISGTVGVSNFDFIFSGGDCICKNRPASFSVILPPISCGVICSWYVNGILIATDDPVTSNIVTRDLNVLEGDEVKAVIEIRNKCSKINSIIVSECQNCP